MSFEEFCNITRKGIKNGIIKITDTNTKENIELSDLDLAIQYVIGMEQEKSGNSKINLSIDKVYDLIGYYCGNDVREKLFC